MDKNTEIKPLVSVNICTYNRSKLLSKAIDSVLQQTYQSLEIIILDDNSEDNTADIVAKYEDSRIKYIKNETNLGINKNRNKALSLSKGKYIAVLDSDDYWVNENKIEDQVNFLENNPNYAVIGTYTNFVNQNNEIVKTFKPQTLDAKIRSKMLLQNQFTHSSVVFKKSFFQEYIEKYYIWEDYATILKIGRNYKFANLPIITTNYLIHSSNISNTKKKEGIKTLGKIIKDNKKYYPHYYLAYLKNILRCFK